ncbi:ABC transporter substrate-binding protein [Pseudoalteromonas sp. T1lg23B]|uniref:ABC transporter substrate-binding protein n=1 Tax=Pseudoalteromonas sp. T1lg23B TaxID=2077097 RepID=UPI001F48C288|nr:ABC transporter substrate-binding protein [Pseudoalteromonas sp. T1lg23B]
MVASYISIAKEAPRVLKIYHDSDYSNHNASALAMKMGFATALAQVNNQIQGYELQLVEKDHRGNSNRSFLHMRQYLNDPNALAVLGGLHSPPYIKFREFINDNGVLLLVPWAAGGPITRYPNAENWVFRLSIDDTKAGYTLVEHAKQNLYCSNMQLLLENTPWGESNEKTMRAAVGSHSIAGVTWFNWNTQYASARIIIRDIVQSDADCILFVGNALEGKHFVNAMASFADTNKLPIISHWGITGGAFFPAVKESLNSGLVLHFIQSCFSLRDYRSHTYAKEVVTLAQRLYPERLQFPEQLAAPTGFIHSYDLGKLLLQGLQQIKLSDDMTSNRKLLRSALERLNDPVVGLIKTYKKPFSVWSMSNQDAHEALGKDDFCMARYAHDGGVTLLPKGRNEVVENETTSD